MNTNDLKISLNGLKAGSELLQGLAEDGFFILDGVLHDVDIQAMRKIIFDNIISFKRTRPSISSGHIAGFHRHLAFQEIQPKLFANGMLPLAIDALEIQRPKLIGLSDITINRSQPWHTDLLRGRYAGYLSDDIIWGEGGGKVYKILAYLQDSVSLRVVPGSHKNRIPLESDEYTIDVGERQGVQVPATRGSVVLMDIRLIHRGAEESAYMSGKWDHDPRILVSSVIGEEASPFSRAMEQGNLRRMIDWEERHKNAPMPNLKI